MTDEPRRLRDESESALERALLGAGKSYPTSRDTRAKALAALGLAGSATLAAGTATAAVASSGSSFSAWLKLGWSKVVVGVSLAGAASVPVGYYAWQHHRDAGAAHAPAAGAARTVAAVEVAPLPPPVEEAPAPAATAPAAEVAEAPLPAPAPVRVRASKGAVAHSSSSLSQELFALDRAREALADGNAPRALTLLDGYGKTHPRGRLELEAEVLRIDALAQDGRDGLARHRAMAFLRRHPNSLLAPRVRAHLDASLDD
jgi:hypothetical protein